MNNRIFQEDGRSDGFRYPDPKQIKLDQTNSRIFLPKLGWLRYRNSRKVLGTVKNDTVSQSCGKWFMSIQTGREVEQVLPQGEAVGIDMGVVRFATLSDGTFHAPLNSFRRHEDALRRAQQAMRRRGRVALGSNEASSSPSQCGAASPATSALSVPRPSHASLWVGAAK